MSEPPFVIDAARVVEYAVFDTSSRPTGHVSAVEGGVTVDLSTVRALAITESLVDGATFLLHCNERWETVVAGQYPDADAARASAQRAYSGVTARWTRYRELTESERKEIETTRAFLRELATDYGDGVGGG